jgi:hypothetical protein
VVVLDGSVVVVLDGSVVVLDGVTEPTVIVWVVEFAMPVPYAGPLTAHTV